MSAVAWTHWDEAFLAAEKEPGKRLTFTLAPALFERALVSLAAEHGWLPKSDARYQEACADGYLRWWDGRGRCVVLVREGSNAYTQMLAPPGARTPKFAELPMREPDAPPETLARNPRDPLVPDPVADLSNARIRRETAEGLATAINTSGAGVASVAPDGNVDIVSVRQPPPPGVTKDIEPSGIVAAVKSVLPKGKKK